MTPRMKPETITPEIAAKWLESNYSNRPLRQAHIDALARDITNGDYRLTGDPIRFDSNGDLFDGQHRLWAIIQADLPVESYVARGLDPAVKQIVDTGAKRTLGDALALTGEHSTHLLAGIINIVWKFDRDGYSSNVSPTHLEAMEWLAQNREVIDAVGIAGQVRASLKVAPSPVGAAFFLNARTDASASAAFWEAAATGEGLAAGDPVLALRRWVYGMLAKRDKPQARVQLAYYLVAMNAWREERSVRIVHWRAENGMPAPWK